ncbi:MAG: trypsin-like peptidase domain-containing protein [Jatrophihabitantaceae bacterium]
MPQPVATTSRTGRRRAMVIAWVGAVVAAGVIAGVTVLVPHTRTVLGSGTAALAAGGSTVNGSTNGTGNGSSSGSGWGYGGYGYGGAGGDGSHGGSGSDSGGSGGGSSAGTPQTTDATTSATAAQSVGVVDINTVLTYQNARAAGTGMVLTSSGEILTNNHVVNGATSLSVTVVSTGATYTATVVGTDPTQDVAVIQLQNASGLQTANFGSAGAAAVGNSVTGVGNAGGTGGTPSAAKGTISALGQSITATDDDGSNPEKLTGLIQTNAPIQAGDSGGPLYSSSGAIIGMDTAAQSARDGSTIAGYAITIDTAEHVAATIEAGVASSTVHLGYPAFLGVLLSASATTPLVEQVVAGGPADLTGLTGGDTITAVGSTPVTTATGLQQALKAYRPGAQVQITWTDASGQTHHAAAILVQGPAD